LNHRNTKGGLALLLLVTLFALAGCSPGAMVSPGWGGLGSHAGTLFAASSRGKIYALNPDSGVQKWVFPRSEKEAKGPFYSAVVGEGELVFVSSFGGTLYALDAATGMERWVFEREEAFVGAAAIADGEVYVGNADGKVYALDAGNGVLNWEFQTGSWIWSTPVVDGDRLYVASMDHKLYCLDRTSAGTKKWETVHEGGAIPGTPL